MAGFPHGIQKNYFFYPLPPQMLLCCVMDHGTAGALGGILASNINIGTTTKAICAFLSITNLFSPPELLQSRDLSCSLCLCSTPTNVQIHKLHCNYPLHKFRPATRDCQEQGNKHLELDRKYPNGHWGGNASWKQHNCPFTAPWVLHLSCWRWICGSGKIKITL